MARLGETGGVPSPATRPSLSHEALIDVLEKHRRWASGDSAGTRADLSYADLHGANLRGANLRVANLSYADLHGADLSYANLRVANLRGATGIVRLPVGDPRGYDCIAVWHTDGWRIAAGCRYLTLSEARQHWGASYDGEREIGDRYLYALDWLAQQPEPKEKA